jgi:hypothetical protein
MRIITIEIDKEKDLSVIEQFLDNLGLKYHLDDTEALEKSILTGYDQSQKGLTNWTPEAEKTFLQNLEYLAYRWNNKVITDFIKIR